MIETASPLAFITTSLLLVLLMLSLLLLFRSFRPNNNVDSFILVVAWRTHVIFVVVQHHVDGAVDDIDGESVPSRLSS